MKTVEMNSLQVKVLLSAQRTWLNNTHIITGASVYENELQVFTGSSTSVTRKISVMSVAGNKNTSLD